MFLDNIQPYTTRFDFSVLYRFLITSAVPRMLSGNLLSKKLFSEVSKVLSKFDGDRENDIIDYHLPSIDIRFVLYSWLAN